MPAWFRAGLVAALFVFAAAPLTPVQSAEKTFQDAALDDAAIKLEAELKEEAGTVEKPVIALKKDADAALKKGDLETAADIYVQIVTVAPNDAQAWRRLADLWLKIPTTDEDDGQHAATERATTAVLYRLPAFSDRGGRSRFPRHARQRLWQAQRLASGTECARSRAQAASRRRS